MNKIYEAYTNVINEAKPISVRDFFTKYMGSSKWHKDWQTANVMTINGKHAQEKKSNTEIVKLLTKWFNDNPTINVIKKGDELNFKIGSDKISVQTG